jgi:hypothetical protein
MGVTFMLKSATTERVRLLRVAAIVSIVLPLIVQFVHAGRAWWDYGWRYRAQVTVSADGQARYDRPAEVPINFSTILNSLGASGSLNTNSIRVVETDSIGTIQNSAVPFQFDKDPTFDSASSASGALVFMLTGTTPSAAKRYFDVYFDTNSAIPVASVVPLVGVDENASDEGQSAYKVTGLGVTYYYQKDAGGFSSMLDKNSVDWLDFHPTPGSQSSGEYRGVPNAIFSIPNPSLNAFHPGKTNSTSSIVARGPLKITVHTATNNGQFECLWSFYPRYTTMTMTKAAFNYWWLVEGVPGGTLEPSQDFMYRSDGVKQFLDVMYTGTISSPEWVYFGDKSGTRSLYAMHHEADAAPDCYYTLDGVMTVFGFGRDGLELSGYIDATRNQTFTLGLLEGTAFAQCADSINAIYKPLSVTVGASEKALLASPSLVSPIDSTTNVSMPGLLVWRTSTGAMRYHLQVSTSSAFTAGIIIDDSTLVDTSFTVNGLNQGTVYFWRVCALHASVTSLYSETRRFTPEAGVVCRGLSLQGGWNLASIPVQPANTSPNVLFPVVASAVYEYSDGYVASTAIAPGKGYWLKYTTGAATSVCGLQTADSTIPLQAGWNLIGGYDRAVQVASVTTIPSSIIASNFYMYDSGYLQADSIQPGKGYWVKAMQGGTLNLPRSSFKQGSEGIVPARIRPEWAQIQIHDNSGNFGQVYLAKNGDEVGMFELPPVPPAEAFDVRFNTDRIVEAMDRPSNTITITGARYPLKLTAKGVSLRVSDSYDGSLFSKVLKSGENVILEKDAGPLKVDVLQFPAAFTLSQNYPNPFNPKTVISCQWPVASTVKLAVYDLLGREVAVLVNERRDPGRYTLEFDASDLASGVYIYRLTAGEYAASKKMVLAR